MGIAFHVIIYYCTNSYISSAVKIASASLIPKYTQRPTHKRHKPNGPKKGEHR